MCYSAIKKLIDTTNSYILRLPDFQRRSSGHTVDALTPKSLITGSLVMRAAGTHKVVQLVTMFSHVYACRMSCRLRYVLIEGDGYSCMLTRSNDKQLNMFVVVLGHSL